MGEVLPYRSPSARAESTAQVGMVVFLGSWAMMFASLFFAYGVVRSRAPIWPPADLPHLPFWLPLINTGVVAGSSLGLELAIRNMIKGDVRRVGPLISGAMMLGVVFLALQISMWADLHQKGLTPQTGTYASVFYALTCFHALHVLVGLGALGWLSLRAFMRFYTPARFLPIRLWTRYWHFVGVVWALLFVLVYIL